jgi:hypothetical protein
MFCLDESLGLKLANAWMEFKTQYVLAGNKRPNAAATKKLNSVFSESDIDYLKNAKKYFRCDAETVFELFRNPEFCEFCGDYCHSSSYNVCWNCFEKGAGYRTLRYKRAQQVTDKTRVIVSIITRLDAQKQADLTFLERYQDEIKFVKYDELLAQEVLSVWDTLYSEAKQKSLGTSGAKPSKTAAAVLVKTLKPAALHYYKLVLAHLNMGLHKNAVRSTDVIEALTKPTDCKYCGSLCLPSDVFICRVCESINPNLVKERRLASNHMHSDVRNLALRNRSLVEKLVSIEKVRLTMGANWVGGHNTRDPEWIAAQLAKNGGVLPLHTPESKTNAKLGLVRSLGVDNPTKHPIVCAKAKATYMRNHDGARSPFENPEVWEKMRNRALEKSGGLCTHHMQIPEIRAKGLRTSRKLYKIELEGKLFEVQGLSEAAAVPYLASIYGVENLFTQFHTGTYPLDRIHKYWVIDFWVRGVDNFVEVKSLWTLTGFSYEDKVLKDYYLDNVRKAILFPECLWLIHYKDSFVWLPDDWPNKPNIRFWVHAAFEMHRGSYAALVENRQYLVDILLALDSTVKVELTDYGLLLLDQKIALFTPSSFWNGTAALGWGTRQHAMEIKSSLAAQGYRCIQIWDYVRKHHRLALIGFCRNLLNLGRKINARQCSVIELPFNDKRVIQLYTKNHLQGPPTQGTTYCLFDEDDTLVAAMTFGHTLSNRGSTKKISEYELIRYATIGNVRGGASKLFAAFVAKNHPTKIVSYSDTQMFEGGLYEKLGFVLDDTVRPTYTTVFDFENLHVGSKQSTSLHKFMQRHEYVDGLTETQHAQLYEYHRIYNDGRKKWVRNF